MPTHGTTQPTTPPAPTAQGPLDAAVLRRWAGAARDALGEARAEIDALNVYPVADADTGTNLYLTMEAAAAAADGAGDDPGEVLRALADGALLAARGSSGVILSALLRGIADRLGRPGSLPPTGRDIADAMGSAVDLAHAAVARPVEGTMLTVARAAAVAAAVAAGPADDPTSDPAARSGAPVFRVVRSAARGARTALDATQQQLPELSRAGVVDAGGRGLTVLLDALDTTLTGWRPLSRTPAARPPAPASPGAPPAGDRPGGPAYEVTYLLDAPPEAAATLRGTLDVLGDSALVVGGDGLWTVHVHVDDVGAAVEAGIEAGRPHRVQVVRFADAPPPATAWTTLAGRAVVVVPGGAGLTALYEDAGARVVPPAAGVRWSTGELLTAVRAAGAGEVVLLPNDRDLLPAAEAAAAQARESGRRVAVIPTRAEVQALAALAVHSPGRPFEEDVVAMTAAAGSTRTGAVAVAESEAMTSGGPCRAGDALGLVEDDVVVVGPDLPSVALEVVHRMLSAGGELLTLVTAPDGELLAEEVVDSLRRTRPDVDTAVHHGGPAGRPLLLGVE